jgi:outer membrane protein OmpA-like peptidoglycan-associated protein
MKKTSSITRTFASLLHRSFTQLCWVARATLVGACVLTAQAQERDHGVDRPLGATYTAFKDLAPEQTRLVFYRPEGDGLGVITLHIDGRYHTSLQNGAFSALCLERASVNLQAQPGRSWARADAAREVSQNVVMSGGQTLYVRLSEVLATRPRMDVVPASIGAQEVQTTREQMHSLSRVPLAKPCFQASFPALVFAPEIVTLSAQSAKNPAELAQLLKRLEQQYGAFKRASVHIVGHANDLSNEASNDLVSKELAAEVQRYFVNQSTRFNPITSEGRGSKDRHNAGAQPTRRVEIGVTVLAN